MDLLKELGPLALGSRLKRLSDRLMQDGIKVYQRCDLDFEPKWFPVFYYLSERGPSPVTEIARGIGITHPSVNQVAKEMLQRGLVAAYKDPKDKRRRVLALSAAGKAQRPALTKIWSQIQRALAELLEESGGDFLGQMERLEHSLAGASFLNRFEAHSERDNNLLTIVPFRPDLASVFREINEHWIEAYFALEPADLKVLQDPITTIIEPGGSILFVADESGDLIGTCALIRHEDGVAELAKMGVYDRQRSRGAGKLLGQAIMALAARQGFDKVFLETNSRLAPAIHLYRQLGFVRKPFPNPSDYGRADVYMEWLRTPASE